MTGPVTLCNECEPLVFEELNACASCTSNRRRGAFQTREILRSAGGVPSASNEVLRHAVRQTSIEYNADGVCNMLQRIVDAEQFLLSQPKDLYGQQLATLFNTKLLQIPVKINQVLSASTTSIVCGATIRQSANMSQIGPWTFVESFSKRRTRAVLGGTSA